MSKWKPEETESVQSMVNNGLSVMEISKKIRRTPSSVEAKIKHMKRNARVFIPESSMKKYTQPLKSEGDAVILSDVEAPFHHSEFINRVLDLAYSWKINTIHLAGDLLHYDSLSAWGAEWIPDDTNESISALMEFIETLPEKYKARGIEKMESVKLLAPSDGYSDEIAEARIMFRSMQDFNVYVALGNHDDRYLRALDKAINPRELLVQLDQHHNDNWKIAAYYYTLLETSKGIFRITHPRGAARNTAQSLAVQFHQHVIMGHSHRWAVNKDPSGDYWAIQTGHCVDEKRLAYVMQRDATRDAHCLGATIVRDGYPFVLSENTPFETMKRW